MQYLPVRDTYYDSFVFAVGAVVNKKNNNYMPFSFRNFNKRQRFLSTLSLYQFYEVCRHRAVGEDKYCLADNTSR